MKRFLFLLLIAASAAHAGTAKIAWDHSTPGNVTHYRVSYLDKQSGLSCANHDFDAGDIRNASMQLEYEFTDILDCSSPCFAAQACNASDVCSDWSEPVDSWPRPEPLTLDPPEFARGRSYSVAGTGNSIRQNSTFEVGTTGVTITNFVGRIGGDCTVFGFDITVSPVADLGSFNFEIINDDQGDGRIFGVGNGLVVVVDDLEPPTKPTALRRVFRKP